MLAVSGWTRSQTAAVGPWLPSERQSVASTSRCPSRRLREAVPQQLLLLQSALSAAHTRLPLVRSCENGTVAPPPSAVAYWLPDRICDFFAQSNPQLGLGTPPWNALSALHQHSHSRRTATSLAGQEAGTGRPAKGGAAARARKALSGPSLPARALGKCLADASRRLTHHSYAILGWCVDTDSHDLPLPSTSARV